MIHVTGMNQNYHRFYKHCFLKLQGGIDDWSETLVWEGLKMLLWTSTNLYVSLAASDSEET